MNIIALQLVIYSDTENEYLNIVWKNSVGGGGFLWRLGFFPVCFFFGRERGVLIVSLANVFCVQ